VSKRFIRSVLTLLSLACPSQVVTYLARHHPHVTALLLFLRVTDRKEEAQAAAAAAEAERKGKAKLGGAAVETETELGPRGGSRCGPIAVSGPY
jgi:hypothetical protein